MQGGFTTADDVAGTLLPEQEVTEEVSASSLPCWPPEEPALSPRLSCRHPALQTCCLQTMGPGTGSGTCCVFVHRWCLQVTSEDSPRAWLGGAVVQSEGLSLTPPSPPLP